MQNSQQKKKLSDETKKLINKKIESNWINPLALQPQA